VSKTLSALCAVLIIYVGLARTCHSAQGETLLYADHGDWASFALQLDPITRYRAATAFLEQGDYVSLNFDRLPGTCETLYVSLQVNLDGLLSRKIDVHDAHGLLRVDERAVRQIGYRLQADAGTSSMVISVSEIDGGPVAIDELLAGEMLRFKLDTDRKDYYVRFSLHGFRDAIQRTLTMCNRYGSEGDHRYFEDAPATPGAAPDQSHPIERF